MREIDNKINSKLNIVNKKFEEINSKIDSRLDSNFSVNFQKAFNEEKNSNYSKLSIDEILKQFNSIPKNDILSSINGDNIIEFRGFKMKAKVASQFMELEKMIQQYFPGRQVIITSGMDGQHLPNSAHYRGEALDFVVEPLSVEESKIVEKLAEKAGFKVYNEYIYDSPYKTGPHMHIQL
jgi:hypothetical protein